MKKIVLVLLLAGLAWWYFIGGRTMTEAAVREHYEEYAQAMTRFDADYFCDTLDDDFQASDIAFSVAGQKKTEADRDSACGNARQALKILSGIDGMSGGQLAFSFTNTVNKVTLSEDRKTATVEGEGRMMMGGSLLAKIKFTEELVRRNGTILRAHTDSRSWHYTR